MITANTGKQVMANSSPVEGRQADRSAIPFIDLQAQHRRIKTEIDAAIAQVLTHGQFIMGPEVTELEAQLAELAGTEYCITCANGTDALVLALRAAGIGSGDGVFVPAFTFTATAEAVRLVGATPVVCDVLADTFNLDPDSLESAIPVARGLDLRPRAVIPVDLFGQPADYRALLPLAERNGLTTIVDGAQSLGARLDGQSTASIGQLATTSFFPAKPLGCYGDGGAIFTDDQKLAEILRSLRQHGKGQNKYDNLHVGMNSRLDTLQASILIAKLKIFPDEVLQRQRVADLYSTALSDTVKTPHIINGATSVWAQYTVRVTGKCRNQIAHDLHSQDIPTAVYYPKPLHQQTAYQACPRAAAHLPVSEMLVNEVLSLPMHPYLDAPVQNQIISALQRAAQN